MFAEFYLTDGTNRVNLLSANQTGFGVGVDTARFKRIIRDTSSLDSSVTQSYGILYTTVGESYRIKIGGLSQNEAIAYQRALDSILLQAENYFITNEEQSMVWLVSRARDETNARYAVIYNGQIAEYSDLYDQPFNQAAGSVMIDLDLAIVRSAWLANPPKTPACKPITNTVNWQNYNPSWVSRSAAATSGLALYTVASNGNMFAGSDPNILISTNNGASWATTKALSAGNIAQQFIVAFGKIYAAVARAAGATSNSGIWSATLAGGSWTQEVSSANCYSFTILSDGRLLCGGSGTIRVQSASGGAWTTYSSVFTGEVRALLTTATGALLAGDAYDLWRQPKGGALALTAVNSIGPYYSLVEFNNRIMVLGTYSNGSAGQIDVSFDDGATFSALISTNAGNTLYYSATKNTIYRSQATGIYYSTDNGLKWIFSDLSGSAGGGIAESLTGGLFNINSNNIWEMVQTTVASGPVAPTTCTSVVLIGNRFSEPMLFTIMYLDASGPTYTNLGGAVSTSGAAVFPSTIAVGDILYLGVLPNNVAIHSLPNSYYFNLTVFNKTTTFVYEYWNGAAWTALLQVVDTTVGLKRSGLLSWVNQTNSAVTSINSISANWIRIRVTAIGSVTTPPQASSIYAPVRNYVEVIGIGGDIPALAEFKLTNANDGGDGTNWTRTSTMLIALRSQERGATFKPYVLPNLPYNPATVGAYSTLTDWTVIPSGYYWKCTPGTSYENYVGYYLDFTAGGYNIAPYPLSKDHYGTHRVFLRYAYYGTDQAITVKLILKNVGEQIFATSEEFALTTVVSTKGGARLLDMGQFTIGASGSLDADEVGNNMYFDLQAKGNATDFFAAFELIIMPADEWIGYFEDLGKANINNYGSLTVNTTLDIDSASYFKRQLRAIVKPGGLDTVISTWSPQATGALMLQPGKTQRYYFLSELWNGEYLANPYTPVHQVQLYRHERFLGGRGNG